MGYVQKRFGKGPSDFAGMTAKQATNFLLDMVSALEMEKRSGSYISNCVKPVKSWLDFNGIQIKQRIKISGRDELVRVADEHPPTPDELRQIFNMADFRTRVACALVALCGVRIEVIGSYLGKDGLQLRDMPELKVKEGIVEFSKTPALVIVRKSLSKIRNQFFTFLSEEGCEYLKQYLEFRVREGEVLAPNSPIVTPSKLALAGRHIRTINVSDLIRKPIRAAGFKWRPYVLRRYFGTRLMMAESDGLIIRDYRQFWMGHKGDIEHVYTVNKSLSEDTVEKMRESYRIAALRYLQTKKGEVGEDQIKQAFKKQLLAVSGFTEEEILKYDINKMSDEELHTLVRQRLLGVMSNNGSRQKVVGTHEVERYVAEGWEYVASINNDKAIVKIPF
jgi:integrase